MDNKQHIASYIKQNTRNKIVFCRTSIPDIENVNVGRELSIMLNNKPTDESAYNSLCRQVLSQITSDEQIGCYLALDNIGILFERELKIDLHGLLDTYSKNQCLIIRTDSEIVNDTLYFLSKADGIEVSLAGLSYTILN